MSSDFQLYGEHLRSYLSDESRLTGSFKQISYPCSTEELIAVLHDLIAAHTPFTLQGARTGISGAAVPKNGMVVSTEKSQSISSIQGNEEEGFYVIADAGARLYAVNTAAIAEGLIFAPNPGEETATIGGLFSVGAYGSNSFRYGSVAASVSSADILLPSGEIITVRRGENLFKEKGVFLPNGNFLSALVSSDNQTICAFTPQPGSDLLDVFAGSEGMFGIAIRLKLSLGTAPYNPKAVVFFFTNEDVGAAFGNRIKKTGIPDFVEYFDKNALSIIDRQKHVLPKLKDLPDFPLDAVCAIYIELTSLFAEETEEWLMDRLEDFEASGGREDYTWAAFGQYEADRFRILRHALPEAINIRIDEIRRINNDIIKTCADITAPNADTEEFLSYCKTTAASPGIEHYVFGHLAENRLHINFVPKDRKESCLAEEAILKICRFSIRNGGKIFSENGIGRTKAALFKQLVSEEELALLQEIKHFFDPDRLFNPECFL